MLKKLFGALLTITLVVALTGCATTPGATGPVVDFFAKDSTRTLIKATAMGAVVYAAEKDQDLKRPEAKRVIDEYVALRGYPDGYLPLVTTVTNDAAELAPDAVWVSDLADVYFFAVVLYGDEIKDYFNTKVLSILDERP